MPAANPAVTAQPNTPVKEPRPHLWTRLSVKATTLALAAPIVLSFAGALPETAFGAESRNCGGWNSHTNPPTSIRVYRRQSGRVEVVNFRKYVVTVLGKEWPGYLPQPLVEAGAVAVKQYAWFHAMDGGRQRVTRDGRCYDVMDGTGDQLYKPDRARIRTDHYRALDATWHVSLRKGGNFFMTGYRRGNKNNCGADATGWKLFARSATRCAYRGYNWRAILKTYYGPGLTLVGDGHASGAGAPTPEASPPQTPETTPGDASTLQSSSGAGRVVDQRGSTKPAAPPAAPLGIGGGRHGGLSATADGYGVVGPGPLISGSATVL